MLDNNLNEESEADDVVSINGLTEQQTQMAKEFFDLVSTDGLELNVVLDHNGIERLGICSYVEEDDVSYLVGVLFNVDDKPSQLYRFKEEIEQGVIFSEPVKPGIFSRMLSRIYKR